MAEADKLRAAAEGAESQADVKLAAAARHAADNAALRQRLHTLEGELSQTQERAQVARDEATTAQAKLRDAERRCGGLRFGSPRPRLCRGASLASPMRVCRSGPVSCTPRPSSCGSKPANSRARLLA